MLCSQITTLFSVLASLATLTYAAPLAPEPLHKLQIRKAQGIQNGQVSHRISSLSIPLS